MTNQQINETEAQAKLKSAEAKMKNAESREKATATRQRLNEARTDMWREQSEAIRTARIALQRILEREDATIDQTMEAARLLVSLGR